MISDVEMSSYNQYQLMERLSQLESVNSARLSDCSYENVEVMATESKIFELK